MRNRPYAKLRILLIPAAFLATYLAFEALARSVELRLPLFLSICWWIYTAGMLHVIVMGLLGALWLRLPIEQMSFGLGKRWLRVKIAGVPISFGIWFLDSNVIFDDEMISSIGWRRCVLELSGCAVLIALASIIMGRLTVLDVLAFWQQLSTGALSPFGHAQAVLVDLGRYLSQLDQLSMLAAVSFGMAAANLLPLPRLNGGRAIMYLVSVTLYPLTERFMERLYLVGFLVYFWIVGSWFLALLSLVYDNWVRDLVQIIWA